MPSSNQPLHDAMRTLDATLEQYEEVRAYGAQQTLGGLEARAAIGYRTAEVYICRASYAAHQKEVAGYLTALATYWRAVGDVSRGQARALSEGTALARRAAEIARETEADWRARLAEARRQLYGAADQRAYPWYERLGGLYCAPCALMMFAAHQGADMTVPLEDKPAAGARCIFCGADESPDI